MQKHRMMVVGGAILGVALLASLAIAQGKQAFGQAKFDRHLAFMTTALDLTDAQVQQIKQIHAAEAPKYQAFRQSMKGAAPQMQSLIATDNFDEAAVRSAISQHQQIMQDMMVEHAREMNAVYKILTPAQREKAVKMFQNFGPFGHGGHHGFHEDGPPPAPPAQ